MKPETKKPWESRHEAQRKAEEAVGSKKIQLSGWGFIILWAFIAFCAFWMPKLDTWVEQNVRPAGEAEEAAIPVESPDAEGDK